MVIAREFEYSRPATLDEAVGLLSGAAGAAVVLAGGTDLVAWLRDEAVAPDLVVDIKDVDGLDVLSLDAGRLTIGALTTFTDLIESEVVADAAPLVREMARTVASPGIRNRATVVGNICSAVPSCDAGPVLLACDAVVNLIGPAGVRGVPIGDWFVGPRATARRDGEVVTHVTFDIEPHGGCYVKLMRYGGEDLAQAAVAVVVDRNLSYRVAFGAVAPTPIRAEPIEDLLAGHRPSDDLLASAVEMVGRLISPITDLRSSADYRTHMCEVMLRRGLVAAVERLDGRGPPYGERLI